MIAFIAASLPFICLLFSFYAFMSDNAIWYWHQPSNKQNPINEEHRYTFNIKVAKVFLIVSIIMFIPCVLYEFDIIDKHLSFMIVCCLFTICGLAIMFYWHSLYQKYKK